MKLRKFLLLDLLLFFSMAVASADGIPMPEVKKLSNRVYALLGPVGFPSKANHGYMVNTTVLIGDKGVILVDTGFTDEIGRHLKKEIARITSKPVTHIINTHHHGDHVLGNSEFPGAQIISSEKCRELVNKLGYEWIGTVETMTGKKYPNTRPVAAGKVYPGKTRTMVTIQGIKMELIVPPGSHTPGDMMIYLPGEKILISGDILVQKMIPSFVDAQVKTWVNTLDQISRMDIKTAIPGHGPLMNLQDIRAMHRRMSVFYSGVVAGYKKGLTDSEIRNTLDLTEWKKMVEFEGLMGININRTFLQVEQEYF